MRIDSFAQTGDDSTIITDTVILPLPDTIVDLNADTLRSIDSFSKRPNLDSGWTLPAGVSISIPELTRVVLEHHPWLGFSTTPFSQQLDFKRFHGKELFFYVLVFLLLIYAILKGSFPKYFNDLFRLFFRTTLKQRQIREQLMQTPLPSLMLNAFFIASSGLYISFILKHYQLNPMGNFWLMALYCCLGLSLAYSVKFLGLKISGWLFNMKEAADSYIFIVFIVNKMIGILLMPFVILLAFTEGPVYSISLNLSYCLLAGLLLYRFILTFGAIRNQVKVNPFHFFLYLLAFEIAPLLLIYKALLLYFRQTV